MKSSTTSFKFFRLILVGFLPLLGISSAAAQAIATRAALNSILGPDSVTDTFETFTNSSQLFFAGPLNSSSVISGLGGPGLVASNNSYSVTTGSLIANVAGYYSLVGRTLGDGVASSGRAMTITFTVPVRAAGFDLQPYIGYSMSGQVQVFNATGSLLNAGLTAVNQAFFGWEDPGGIASIRIAADSGAYIMLDNVTSGLTVIPEPATCALCLALIFLAVAVWPRKEMEPAGHEPSGSQRKNAGAIGDAVPVSDCLEDCVQGLAGAEGR